MANTGVVQQQFSVPFRYDVVFTRGLFDPENPAFAAALGRLESQRRHKILCFVDEGLNAAQPDLIARIATYAKAHADSIENIAAPIVVPGGEAAKQDPELLQRLQEAMVRHHVDRQSFVVILGGGAVLDTVGYAAATVHRGLRTIRVPTTVLAQNDSGVGVKNGVNAFGAKNMLGTFAPPFAVLSDFDLLKTLPKRDAVAGFAEAVKVALIRDANFFSWLEDHAQELAALQWDAVSYLVRRCAELHLAHIATSGDPFECGSAKPLDFGHWSAHRLEGLTDHRLRHGEAVSIGMAIDCGYAEKTGLLAGDIHQRVISLLAALGLPTWDDALDQKNADGQLEVLQGLQEFREHLGGDLTVTLLRNVGRAQEAHQIDLAIMASAIEALRPQQHRTPDTAAGRMGT